MNYLCIVVASFYSLFRRFKGGYDLFVSQLSPISVLIPAILFKKRNVKLVCWVHDVGPSRAVSCNHVSRAATRAACNRLYQSCDIIYAQSDSMAWELKRRLKRDIRVLPNCIEGDLRLTDRGLPLEGSIKKLSHRKTLLFAGNIGENHGLENVIQTLSSREFSDWALLIVGDGRGLLALKEQAMLNRTAKVEFFGSLSPERAQQMARNADVNLVCLKVTAVSQFTVPLNFTSYLSAGRPILSLGGGACHEQVQSKQLGWSSMSGCLEDIRLTMLDMVRHYDTHERIFSRNVSAASRKYVKANVLNRFFSDIELLSD